MSDVSRRFLLQASAGAVAAAKTGAVSTAFLASEAAAQEQQTTAARYILKRLHQNNVRHIFGVPGATCDPMFKEASSEGMALVVTASDLDAGYAADGYARMRGLGAVTVSRGVGMLSLVNAIAGAYAERSAVVVINGGPSQLDLEDEQKLGILFSHSIGRGDTDRKIFEQVTAYAQRASKAAEVPKIVDDAISTALSKKRPVYIEIANHIWDAGKPNCSPPAGMLNSAVKPTGREAQVAKDIRTIIEGGSLNGENFSPAKQPSLLIGADVQRYNLGAQAAALIERMRMPWAVTMLARSGVAEQTAGFAGVYSSQASRLSALHNADRVLAIGTVFSIGYRALVTELVKEKKLIHIADGVSKMPAASPRNVSLSHLLGELQTIEWSPRPVWLKQQSLPGLSFAQRRPRAAPASPPPEASYDQCCKAISDTNTNAFVVMTDTSLSMYPATAINVIGNNGFVCNGLWQSIGYSVPAAIGVGLAQTARRPIVLCGDGGFQMTAQSLSSMVKYSINPIVIVLDNALYAIEQKIIDDSYFSNAAPPAPFLTLNPWRYIDLARSMGFQFTRAAETRVSFVTALAEAKAFNGPAFIACKLRPKNLPAGLS